MCNLNFIEENTLEPRYRKKKNNIALIYDDLFT